MLLPESPYVIRGPDMDGCLNYCSHPNTIGQMAIYWIDTDGKEWGQAVAMGLVDGDLTSAQIHHATTALWREYDKWVAGEIEANSSGPIRGRVDSAR